MPIAPLKSGSPKRSDRLTRFILVPYSLPGFDMVLDVLLNIRGGRCGYWQAIHNGLYLQ